MKYLVGFLLVAGFFFYLGATSDVQGEVKVIQKNAQRTAKLMDRSY